MKKITILACLLALGGSLVFAQGSRPLKAVSSKPAQVNNVIGGDDFTPVANFSNTNKSKRTTGTPIYTQDFSGGIPGDWSIAGSTPSAAMWEYRSDTIAIKGGRGAYSGAPASASQKALVGYGNLKSPTAHNGYMIFDSDYLNNGGVGGGTGTAPGSQLGVLETGSYDFTVGGGHPNVQIEFHQRFGKFSTITSIEVCNDGTTWVPFSIIENDNLDISGGKQRYLDSHVIVDVSSEAGNQSDVKFRFVFDGTQQLPGTGGGTGYYYWQIDDIIFSDVPANELQLVADTVKFVNRIGYYTKVPKNHAGDTIKFSASYYNFGLLAQTNSKVNVTVMRGSTEVFNQTTAPVTINSKATKGVSVPSVLVRPKTEVGVYTYTTTVSQSETDETISNNSKTVSFEVTQNEYARDAGNITANLTTDNFLTSYGAFKAGFLMANSIETYGSDTITSISANLRLNSVGKAGIKFKYQLIDTAEAKNVLAETEDVLADTISGNTWIKMKLKGGGYVVAPGQNYYIALYSYGVDTVPVPPNHQYIGLNSDATVPKQIPGSYVLSCPDNSSGGWFVFTNITQAMMIRAYFNEAPAIIGIANAKENSNLSVYPNPSNGNVRIALGDNEIISSIRITNSLGALVFEEKVSGRESSKNISLAGTKNGIYFVEIKAGEKTYQKKLVIQN